MKKTWDKEEIEEFSNWGALNFFFINWKSLFSFEKELLCSFPANLQRCDVKIAYTTTVPLSLSLSLWVCVPNIYRHCAENLYCWAVLKRPGLENWFQFPWRLIYLRTSIFQNLSFLTSDKMYCFGELHSKSLQVQNWSVMREHVHSFNM